MASCLLLPTSVLRLSQGSPSGLLPSLLRQPAVGICVSIPVAVSRANVVIVFEAAASSVSVT
jgi:hypothetical protein